MSAFNLKPLEMNPSARVCNQEFRALFLNFCALVCILHNKKLNLANIFLLVLKEEKIKKLYMEICEFDCEYEAYRHFLEFDGTLHKSKYIKKYLNSRSPKKKARKSKKVR